MPAGGAGVSEPGLSPAAAAALGHRGCSGRCRSRRRGAAAARRGAPEKTLGCGGGLPAASPSRPRGLAEPKPNNHRRIGLPGLAFPPSGADAVSSPRAGGNPPAAAERGAGRWARRGSGLPAEPPSSREHPSGWSGSATHKQHVLQLRHRCQDAIAFCLLQPIFMFVFIYFLAA